MLKIFFKYFLFLPYGCMYKVTCMYKGYKSHYSSKIFFRLSIKIYFFFLGVFNYYFLFFVQKFLSNKTLEIVSKYFQDFFTLKITQHSTRNIFIKNLHTLLLVGYPSTKLMQIMPTRRHSYLTKVLNDECNPSK